MSTYPFPELLYGLLESQHGMQCGGEHALLLARNASSHATLDTS